MKIDICVSRESYSVLSNLFTQNFARTRHLEAPLLKERELYLSHLLHQGSNQRSVRQVAARLLNVVSILAMTRLRQIESSEIQHAGEKWASSLGQRFQRVPSAEQAIVFRRTANNFLRFHHPVEVVREQVYPFGDVLPQYHRFLKQNRASGTLGPYSMWASQFLRSIESSHQSLSTVSISDVDRFTEDKRLGGAKPRTIRVACQALQTFLKFTERRGWTCDHLASAIRSLTRT